MINLENTLNESEQILNNTIDYILENEMIGLSINESGGVAGFPIVKDIIKLYYRINEIVKDESDFIAPEITNVDNVIDYTLLGKQKVKTKHHTIRIKLDDPAFSFKDIIKMPNSVILVNVYDIIEPDEFKAALIKNTNYDSAYRMGADETINIENREVIAHEIDTIEINVHAINGIVDSRAFCSRFIHEFNHLYQNYNLLLKRNFRERNYLLNKHNFLNDELIGELSDNTFHRLDSVLYLLFNDTEINAFAAGIFGELVAVQPQKSEYKKFLRNSDTWETVSNVGYNANELAYIDDNEMEIIKTLMNKYKINNSLFNIKNLKAFRNKFVNEIKVRFKKLVNAIHRVVGYYFSMHEIYLAESSYTIPDETLWESYNIKMK